MMAFYFIGMLTLAVIWFLLDAIEALPQPKKYQAIAMVIGLIFLTAILDTLSR